MDCWCGGQTGGNLRPTGVALPFEFWLIVEGVRSRIERVRGGGGLGRGTLTQSGSLVALNGLGALCGLRT